MLTRALPGARSTFRDLGWSGDDVFGHSRAGFDPPEAGFERLREQVVAAKPTAIIAADGLNVSFEGRFDLPRFVAGLDRLLDMLAGALPEEKPRIALVTPFRSSCVCWTWGRPRSPASAAAPDVLRHSARALAVLSAGFPVGFVFFCQL